MNQHSFQFGKNRTVLGRDTERDSRRTNAVNHLFIVRIIQVYADLP